MFASSTSKNQSLYSAMNTIPTAEAMATAMLIQLTAPCLFLMAVLFLLGKQDEGENSVVDHVVVVGIKTFADECLAAMVLDRLGTQHFRHDKVGDGAHAHPSQALLDLFTIERHKGRLAGLKVAIVGDILHSRVARSDIFGLTKMGAEVHLAGPKTLLPRFFYFDGVTVHENIEDAIKNADVVNVLRIQLERQQAGLFPSPREYARVFGINDERLRLAKEDVLILHPGPQNKGLEISNAVTYGKNSAIQEQVQNGVAVRMALLDLTLNGGTK